ncbi:substance-P receptor-like [Schistocerca serialis cubense]|uniref:substance-P receptor-like n=1 Tax=Schistocerca serialis cubense TaxID=2023355 RepID=UPI00214F6084|nr:substance-P receptor-like [Schistocerca serialis cubense]
MYGCWTWWRGPVLQDIPLHVTMLTFLLMATDRYRLVLYPYKPRIPVCICALGTWMLAICIVVPYPFYITYLDLEGNYVRGLRGIGVCMVNLPESMEDYMRGLFVLTYVLPLLCMMYLFVRARVEMNLRGPPLAAIMYRARNHDRPESPSVVFRLVNQMVAETYDNGATYDVIYTIFVWFAFLHTFTTPFYFYVWNDGPVTKEQLKMFLCPGSRRRLRRRSERALEAVVAQQQRALPRRPQSLPLELPLPPLGPALPPSADESPVACAAAAAAAAAADADSDTVAAA